MIKKRSSALEKAEARASSIGSLGADLKLGGDLSVAAYKTKIGEVRGKLSSYQQLLSDTEAARRAFDTAEGELSDYSDRMLAAVGVTFSRYSETYALAGGTPKSERTRKKKLTPTATSATGVN